MSQYFEKTGFLGAGRVLTLLATLVLIVAGLKIGKDFFLPVLLALFVATASYPVTHALIKRRIPRIIAIMATVMVNFAFIAGLAVLGLFLIQDLEQKWNSKYAPQIYYQVNEGSQHLASKLNKMGVVDADKQIQNVVRNNLSNLQEIRFERIWLLGTGVLGHVVGFVGASLVLLVLMVFMLSEASDFPHRLQSITRAKGPDISRMLNAIKDIQRYLVIKTIISLITGLLAGLLCWAAGLDFFVLWGILAFALNFIPVIGSLVAGAPPTILALLVAGWPNAILVAGGYLLINNFIGNFLEPILVGRRFGLSTLVIVISVMFWGWVWGPLGMLLAVPLTMVIKVVLDGSNEFRWISVAISSDHPHQPPPTRKLQLPPIQATTHPENPAS